MSVVETLVEVRLKNAEDFLKIKETLSRVGVASKKEKTLYQSCHILHKQGKYYITHFKELFLLDGKTSDFDENDRGRRNTIVDLLEEWGLLEIISKDKVVSPKAPLSQIKIIAHKEKDEWNLVPKYTIGKKRT
jgi:hypothetical protein